MDFGTGFPVDLVLFGMIAVFLILRLRSILGRRTGLERQQQPFQPPPPLGRPGPIIEGRAEPAPPPAARVVPEPTSALGETLARMRAIDRGFDPARFLEGAEAAFRMIVAAFAAGDRAQLRPLVSSDVYHAFEQAIAAREQAGHTQVSEIRAIQSAMIESADLTGTRAQVTVRFVSDQTSLVKDREGRVVSGAEGVTELIDDWTFERDLGARDPAWRLVNVRGG
ncbi:MAG TPA: Tim44/TimA family putative adaptor protein [Acetobacteraceae bacterium]|nr:Tim44/TimA family putative adaptor protein [Acetobacteraceae bacterium]